ncbi:MAG: outer membrane protein assembly factor BamE [Prevotella sp.]|nr:outer membrane protein assembly factor BamE [Prevotella sp.]
MKRILITLGLAAMLTSCGALTSTLGERSSHIQPGMTAQEVQQSLGKPSYRRFNENYEEWEYRKHFLTGDDDVLIVNFRNGRVVAMDSFYEHHPSLPEPHQTKDKKE